MTPLSPALPPSSVEPARPDTTAPGARERAKLEEAARQFEAIFVRKMLSSLETAHQLGNTASAGSSIYGSMITSALADAATAGDGLGLSAVILESLTRSTGAPKS